MEKNVGRRQKKEGGSFLGKLENFLDKNKIILLTFFGAFLIILPRLFASNYITRILTTICIYVGFGLGLNLLTGGLGIVSLGQSGFVGIGAYTAAVLLTRIEGTQFLLVAPIAAILSGIVGIIIGLPALRLRGSYLVIVTMGFGEIMRMIFLNWSSVTNGALGIKNIPRPVIFGIELNLKNYGCYYLILIIVVIIAIISVNIKKSKFGRAFFAIKQDEIAAIMMGINITQYKILAFVLSAMITGYVGAFFAQLQMFIISDTFSFDMSIIILCIVITGGLGTIRGPIAGAIVMITLPEIFRSMQEYRFVLYGVAMVLVMLFRPQGVLGWKTTLPYRLSKGAQKYFDGLMQEELNNEHGI